MLRTTSSLALALALVVSVTAGPAAAQDDAGAFTGAFRVGYRSVDFDGSPGKYREDVNLDDGPRLFDLHFTLLPDGTMGNLVDRVDLDVGDFGGDPFETLRLGVRKFDAFDFTYSRRESEYFYEDVIVPHEVANVRLSNGGDFHGFDFERVQESADLSVEVGSRAAVTFGFDRFTKRGDGTTTLDLSRDEFELERVFDESLDAFQVGVEYRFDRITVVVEEQIKDYENVVESFLPGFSPGENTAPNSATLDFFFLDQPYDFTSRATLLRAVARPTDRWILRGLASVESVDLDLEASERSQGTDFASQPLATDLVGEGEVERDVDQLDLDFTYLVSDRLAVIGGAFSKQLDQEGDFLWGVGRNLGGWEIDTQGFEAGVEYTFTPQLSGSLGARWESREVSHFAVEALEPGLPLALDGERVETDHTGAFGSLAWRPASLPLRVTAEVDQSDVDDPFTLASPTDRLRYRLRAEYGLGGGFALTGSLMGNDSENGNSGWDASYDQANLRLAYTAPAVEASLGYGRVDIRRTIDQRVSFGTLFAIDYDAASDFVDGRLQWTPAESWRLGASATLYESDGTFSGGDRYLLERDDLRVFAEYLFPQSYALRLAWRTVDYGEDDVTVEALPGVADFDDYEADILELSVGYRW
jgi:hypothetical protein